MTEKETNMSEERKPVSFVEQIVIDDLAAGKNGGRLQTRFPPEPNGYLHIGHAKAIAIDFGLAKKYGGVCNLRFDDTNPVKEDTEYIESIEHDIKWLGFQWANVYYASDYFQQLWDFAVWLIKQGRAYVDEQSAEVIAQQKGTTTSPGQNSPFRDRPVEESLRLFEYMNSGNCEPGTLTLRAVRGGEMTDELNLSVACTHTARFADIPAMHFDRGQSSSTVTLTAINDDVPQLDASVRFTAAATDYRRATATLTLTDDDRPAITLRLSRPSVMENESALDDYQPLTATITRDRGTGQDIVVWLTSSRNEVVFDQNRVTIPAGSSQVEVPVRIVKIGRASCRERV